MARTVERSWINEKRLGVEGAALIETYLGMDVGKVLDHAEQLKNILLGKPLENDAAVFRTVREFVVTKLVYFMKLGEDDLDQLQARDLDNLTLVYWQRLADNDVDTAFELAQFCTHQIEELADEGLGRSQAAEAWRRAEAALVRYLETLEEQLLASTGEE